MFYTIFFPVQPQFVSCDFEYLPADTKIFVKDAYDTISKKKLWGPFRKALLSKGVDSQTGFMFTNDPLYKKIQNAIGSTKIGHNHSGFSMAFVMREMEFIALHGEPEYKLLHQIAEE